MMNTNQLMSFLIQYARMLASKSGVTVKIGGDTACTDGKTVWLPALLDVVNTALVKVMYVGYLVHEVCHVLWTDFDVFRSASQQKRPFLNILEDVAIEKRMGEWLPGCRVSLRELVIKLKETNGFGDPAKVSSINALLQAHCRYGLRVKVLGHVVLTDYAEYAAKALSNMLPAGTLGKIDAILDELPATQTTADRLVLVDRLFEVLEETKEQIQQSQPEDGESKPDQGNDQPEDGESKPDQGNDQPEDGESKPDQGNDQPEDGESKPDQGNDQPEDGESKPDQGNGQPEDGESKPDQGNGQPEDGESKPDQGNDQPEDGESKPDQGNGQPEDGESKPDQGNGQPEDGESKPDQGNGQPEDGLSDEIRQQMLDALEQIMQPDETFGSELGDLAKDAFEAEIIECYDPSEAFDFNSVVRNDSTQAADAVHRVKSVTNGLAFRLRSLVESQTYCRRSLKAEGSAIDRKAVHRTTTGDMRVFRHEKRGTGINTAVYVLIDTSGSMYDKIAVAKDTLLSLLLALEQTQGVQVGAARFPNVTLDPELGEYSQGIEEIVAFGERVGPRSGAIEGVMVHGGTPTAQALIYADCELSKVKADRKICFVLTDGEPDDANNLRQVLKGMEAEVIAVGIQTNAVMHYFKKYCVVNQIQDLPTQTFKQLQEVLLGLG